MKTLIVFIILYTVGCANTSYVMKGNVIHAKCFHKSNCDNLAKFMCPYKYSFSAEKILTVDKMKHGSYYISQIKCMIK